MTTAGSDGVLDFTLAPVQGFVGQARRTRDFWMGSYLISYLGAHAMAAVERCGGQITFPFVEDDPLIMAVKGAAQPRSRNDTGARVASLPNRFSANCPDPAQAGRAGAEAVQNAWSGLAMHVWREVRNKLVYSLRNPERLPELACADALPPVWDRQIGNHWETYWVANGGDSGIDQRKNWRHMHLFSEQGEMCTVCGERIVAFGEGLTRWEARELWHGQGGVVEAINTRSPEWNLALETENKERLCAVCLVKRLLPYVAKGAFGWDVRVSFPSTHDLAGKPAVTEDSEMELPYYAVLVMDGDHMGRALSAYPQRKQEISQALALFSQQAPNIIEHQFKGVSVYSGGDDVLALLPVHSALPCALELQKKFTTVCGKPGAEPRLTISAAILCTHVKSPMQAALKSAHDLLDNVAKDAVGRNAFAVQVQKRSGSPLTLAKRWGEDGETAQRIIDLGREVFQSEERSYSSKFLYNTAALLEPFSFESHESPSMSIIDIVPVLAAEYMRGPGALRHVSWDQAVETMRKLVDMCSWDQVDAGADGRRLLQPDAFPLIRFLAEAEEVAEA